MEKKIGTLKTENLQFRYLYGFGILFVVLSHCDGGGISMLSDWMNFGAFHLAIFLFGSGYFFKSDKLAHPLVYFLQKSKALLAPLWFWNLFYGLVLFLMHRLGFTFGEPLSLRNLLLFPISSQNLYVLNMGSWFVFPFFMVHLLYAAGKLLLDRFGQPKLTDRLLQLFFVAAGFAGVWLAGHGYHESVLYPIFRILYFMPFYAAGMLYRDFGEAGYQKAPAPLCLGVCLGISLLLNTYFGRTVYALPSSCDYPFGVAATYLSGLIGILFWLKISQVLDENAKLCKPLAVLGSSTWAIMIHQFAGIMAVKCLFAAANGLLGWFPDFDRTAFLGDIWYLYRPGGISEYALCYVAGAIVVPLFMQKLLKRMSAGCQAYVGRMAKKPGITAAAAKRDAGDEKAAQRTAILVGAAPLGREQAFLEEMLSKAERDNCLVIAVDGGMDFFASQKILPDCWIGDMDSTRKTSTAEAIRGTNEAAPGKAEEMPEDRMIRLPVQKDDTDMAVAAEKAYTAGCRTILIFGGLGGARLSHSMANIQLMLHYDRLGCSVRMLADGMQMEILEGGEIIFSKDTSGLLSVLAVSDAARDVKIEGMKYEYRGSLTNECALGVSNAFVGREARISVKEGALLLIWEKERMDAVVFDMDGVIFDSERLVIDCWQVVADRYRIPDIEAACRECLGINAALTRKLMKQRYGADFPYDAYKKEMSALFHERAAGGKLPQKEGVKELLEYLKKERVKIALASSTRSEVVLRELEEGGLLSYFDQVICGDMVGRSKPEPDIFLKACESLGVNPANAFAIEDSYNGIRSAYRAGMKPIMVPDLAAPTPEMEELSYRIFPSLSDVRTYFEKENAFSKNPANKP